MLLVPLAADGHGIFAVRVTCNVRPMCWLDPLVLVRISNLSCLPNVNCVSICRGCCGFSAFHLSCFFQSRLLGVMATLIWPEGGWPRGVEVFITQLPCRGMSYHRGAE